jgi:hypothetical protein
VNLEVRKVVEPTIPNSKFHIHSSKFNFLEAAELARLIRARELSAKETMAACIEQIERIVTT